MIKCTIFCAGEQGIFENMYIEIDEIYDIMIDEKMRSSLC